MGLQYPIDPLLSDFWIWCKIWCILEQIWCKFLETFWQHCFQNRIELCVGLVLYLAEEPSQVVDLGDLYNVVGQEKVCGNNVGAFPKLITEPVNFYKLCYKKGNIKTESQIFHSSLKHLFRHLMQIRQLSSFFDTLVRFLEHGSERKIHWDRQLYPFLPFADIQLLCFKFKQKSQANGVVSTIVSDVHYSRFLKPAKNLF